MAIGKVHSWKKVIAQIVLLGIPTAILVYYVVWKANNFYNILQNDWLVQGTYFAAGILIAIIFYSYRFRFLTTSAFLILIYWGAYKIIGNTNVGEFDAFFASIKFLLFIILFSYGWLTGWGFSRARYYTIFWSVWLLCTQIIAVSKTTDFKAATIIGDFAPVLAYSFYIIFTAELIRNMNEKEKSFTWFLLKRLFGFV